MSFFRKVCCLFLLNAWFVKASEACACCDGYLERTPIAWDNSGMFYVYRDSYQSCDGVDPEKTHKIEVWRNKALVGCLSVEREGSIQPAITHHFIHDCKGVLKTPSIWGSGENFVNESGLTFSKSLNPAVWRSNIASIYRDNNLHYEHRVQIELLLNGEWTKVYDQTRQADEFIFGGLQVQVWQTPDPKQILLEFEREGGFSSTYFTYQDRFEWIQLPYEIPSLQPPSLEVYGTSKDEKEPWLNLRKKANSTSVIIGQLKDGVWLEQIERRGDWIRVRVRSGADHLKEGWVHRKFTKKIGL